LSRPDPRPRRRLTPSAIAALIAITAFVVLFVVVAVVLIMNM
jgi:hypothetical protein